MSNHQLTATTALDYQHLGKLSAVEFLQDCYDLADAQLIDVMQMVNAAIYGFITIEQAGLMTLERSTDESYEVMLEALQVAIAHIGHLS